MLSRVVQAVPSLGAKPRTEMKPCNSSIQRGCWKTESGQVVVVTNYYFGIKQTVKFRDTVWLIAK